MSATPDHEGRAYQRVVQTFRRRSNALVELDLARVGAAPGAETVRVTDEHPFFVVGRGWTAAKDLESGDALLAAEGTTW
ncbi:polymorphic toxin-type HINT domain-containing protein, partial [Lacticaseibacillus paracasei]